MKRLHCSENSQNGNRHGLYSVLATAVYVAVLCLGMVEPAFALPWEGPLEEIQESLSGPVARGAAIIVFVITGLTIAFGEVQGIFGSMLRVAFGLSFALMAAQWLDMFT